MFLLQLSRDIPKAWSASGHAPCRNKAERGSAFVIVRLPVPGSSISLEPPMISPTSAVSNLKKVTIIRVLKSWLYT